MDHNLNEQDQSVSLIQQYFNGKTIFMTGASGFVGRFLIYKLLKDVNINKVILCLRGKRGKSVEDRFREFKRLELFSFLPSPDLLHKLVPVEGDVTQPDLGLSPQDLEMIVNEVNIVYHSAATIRFTEPLKSATLLHVTGTSYVVDVCHKIKNFEILLHVSSVAAWTINERQVEGVPESDMDPETFSQQMRKASVEDASRMEQQLIGSHSEGKWLNTYALTKSLAELVVARSSLSKVVIVRPPFLASPIAEPQIGWFDEPQSGAGLTALFSFGVIRVGYLNFDQVAEFIPIDVCINGMIRATWFHQEVSNRRVDVYNISSINSQSITTRQLLTEAIDLGYKYPSIKQIRPPIQMYHFQLSKRYVQMKSFVSHTLFALLVDLILLLMGRRAILYNKTKQCAKAVEAVFTTASVYKAELNIETGKLDGIGKSLTALDHRIFPFDVRHMPLRDLCEQNHLRFRRHVLKESDETLDYARRRLKMVDAGYMVFKIAFWSLLMIFVYAVHCITFPHLVLWFPFVAAVSYVAGVFLLG